MLFVCDAPGRKTWFRIETDAEASAEAQLMRHSVDRYFLREEGNARESYRAPSGAMGERNIGLKDHIARSMPLFLTLRADDGEGLATAMLPPRGEADAKFRIIIVGPANADPYAAHADAIKALGKHYDLMLPREKCFPYG